MEIYLWTEDSKSGFDFWKLISDTLYAGKIHVESKKSNSKLVKNVEKLKDTKNMYLIAFDHVFDNSKIDDGSGTNTSMYGRLVDAVESRANVCLLDMYSFEYILLSFSELCNWVAQDRNSLIHPNGYKIGRAHV